MIRDSLVAHGDHAVAEGELKDLLRLAETFGFHLAALDVRQESARHTAAVTEIFAHLIQEVPPDPPEAATVMAELARHGEAAYRNLTEQTPGFIDYFYEATPVREIGLLNLGSRPSHRAQDDRSKYSVRAIPWMFGWGQLRHTLPGWYGIGAALATWRGNDPECLALLQRLYQEWPFFHALLNNSQMSLSKVDAGIAREYARLCERPEVETGIYQCF